MAAKPENASRGFGDSSPQILLAECCYEHFPGPCERLLIRMFFFSNAINSSIFKARFYQDFHVCVKVKNPKHFHMDKSPQGDHHSFMKLTNIRKKNLRPQTLGVGKHK